MSWSDDERLRFERELIELIEDTTGASCTPAPGSLRLVIGGAIVRATWASRATGKLVQGNVELRPHEIAGAMHRAADKLAGLDSAGG